MYYIEVLSPNIGKYKINELTRKHLIDALQSTFTLDLIYTGRKAAALIKQVFVYAFNHTMIDSTSIAENLTSCFPPPPKTINRPAITDPEQALKMFSLFDSYHGSLQTKLALKLSALLFLRPINIRTMRWCNVDFDKTRLYFEAEQMKMDKSFIVPLSTSSIDILKKLEKMHKNKSDYVFPGNRGYIKGRPMSENAVNLAIRALGYSQDQMCAHGFRAMAKTILFEVFEYPESYIEMQLAHDVKDPLGRAYDRTTFLRQRTEMMQTWDDFLHGKINLDLLYEQQSVPWIERQKAWMQYKNQQGNKVLSAY